MAKNYAIVLASGSGNRFGGDIPKQFMLLKGKTILERSVEIFDQNACIDGIIVVITPEYIDRACSVLSKYNKVLRVLKGGQTRKQSSYIGVNSLEDEDANVLIHDCARPLLSQKVLNDCINALNDYDAVAVASDATDTVIEVKDGFITNIPERNSLMNVQTPQCFRLPLIKKAHEMSLDDENFTDDCGLVIKQNLSDIYIVKGDKSNIKITYPNDLVIAEQLINSIN